MLVEINTIALLYLKRMHILYHQPHCSCFLHAIVQISYHPLMYNHFICAFVTIFLVRDSCLPTRPGSVSSTCLLSCQPVYFPVTSLTVESLTISELRAPLLSKNSSERHFCSSCRSDIPYAALWGADPVLDRSHVLVAAFLQPSTRFKPFAEQLSKHLVRAASSNWVSTPLCTLFDPLFSPPCHLLVADIVSTLYSHVTPIFSARRARLPSPPPPP